MWQQPKLRAATHPSTLPARLAAAVKASRQAHREATAKPPITAGLGLASSDDGGISMPQRWKHAGGRRRSRAANDAELDSFGE